MLAKQNPIKCSTSPHCPCRMEKRTVSFYEAGAGSVRRPSEALRFLGSQAFKQVLLYRTGLTVSETELHKETEPQNPPRNLTCP